METWDAVRARRNVRQYTDQPIALVGAEPQDHLHRDWLQYEVVHWDRW
ncbi:MAG TPA: hypothetical protein VJB61_18580 [Actinomycetota bacterium]